MPATGANTTAAAAAAAAGNDNVGAGVGESTVFRACSTSGCRVNKYVEVTKRKCSQFVSEPHIMEKPLMVHGKTAIFQVAGELARLGDIPSLASKTDSVSSGQPIYRIKPGTHAHVINYVFVDEGSDSMEKAKCEDQEAMRVLLDAQRDSAAAKLQKLISTHRGAAQTTVAASAAPPPAPAPAATLDPTLATSAPFATTNPNRTCIATNSVHVTTPQIHPDLSIASVAGALPLSASLSPAPKTTFAAPASPAPTVVQPKRAKTTETEDNTVPYLQAEILKLRRQVAQLNGNAPR
ncbi:uncharacterized protein LOC117781985 [Drosophila innubila]|uniref:uncharacterized protein LOC117781985 n=1 Tax=Drosophila innubila TaxID=198719 RepID=UPI00148E8EBA|nr:uncharacterized protein LOC117781985 [Drosophila innubila]